MSIPDSIVHDMRVDDSTTYQQTNVINLIYYQGKFGETCNIGGYNERNNPQIVHSVCRILDEKDSRKKQIRRSDQLCHRPPRT